MKNKNRLTFLVLAASVLVFYAFGSYHLAKFETVDEHFWKYERVPQYWDALRQKNWKKTYINDKPGISVAFLSGLGLFSAPHPENHRIRDAAETQNNIFTIYDSDQTEKINLSLRLPVLAINGLFLILFFFLIKKITDQWEIAALSVALMSLSPILIGISQIINPDSLLWSSGFAAILSYFALLESKEKKFILLSGLFTGFGLLSKYTANILFPLFILSFFLFYFYNCEKIKKDEGARKYFLREIANFFLILAISWLVFAVFMPAVFLKAKYFYRGTFGFPGIKMLIAPILLLLATTLADILFFKEKLIGFFESFFSRYSEKILKIISALMLFIFLLVIANCWTGQKIVPFDKMRDAIYLHPSLGLEATLKNINPAIKLISVSLLQFYPLVFSLSIPVLFLIMAFWLKIILKGAKNFKLLVFFSTLLPIIFYLAMIKSEVLSSIRYSIMIYPFFYLLSALALIELLAFFNQKKKLLLASGIIILAGIYSLWSIKPFYFNYTNSLLGKNYAITDSWGYGQYEAAQYLNSLPDAQNLVVWADRNGICQFIRGKCLSGYKIDLEKTKPDYFIFSSRGSMRYQFVWKNPELAQKSSVSYYDPKNEPVWSLNIDSRPKNYVKIIKSEE